MNKEFTTEQIEATMDYYGLIYIVDAIKKLRKNEKIYINKKDAKRNLFARVCKLFL